MFGKCFWKLLDAEVAEPASSSPGRLRRYPSVTYKCYHLPLSKKAGGSGVRGENLGFHQTQEPKWRCGGERMGNSHHAELFLNVKALRNEDSAPSPPKKKKIDLDSFFQAVQLHPTGVGGWQTLRLPLRPLNLPSHP